jgi:hypothetical protein
MKLDLQINPEFTQVSDENGDVNFQFLPKSIHVLIDDDRVPLDKLIEAWKDRAWTE